MSKKKLTIWFNKNGDMLTRASYWCRPGNNQGYFSEEGDDFSDHLVYSHLNESDTAKVYFQSKKTGRYYCMFLTDFHVLLSLGLLTNNEVVGDFRFTKRGQSQGIRKILTAHETHLLEELATKERKDDRRRWV